MPFDLGPGTAAALAFALLGAAYVRGYSGFGFSAIFIAFAALVTNPLPLIPVVFACEVLMTVFQARQIRGHVDWRRVLWMLAGAAIALPFSVTVMLSVGEDTARVTISAMILVLSLVLLTGWTLKTRIGPLGHGGVGVISGMCNSAGIGGLPVAAFMSAQPIEAAVFRATMIIYLTGLDIITLPLLWAGGLVTWDTAIAVALAFPILGVGIWLGSRQFLSASPSTFRRFAVMLLLTLAVLGLIRVLLRI
ncbi:sulfite exporter TauE/SafE family protein [Yoonia sp. F2084L]|uniref:sulfite exporter TauE/SafE family protein n=1 Tax=Yoonia sp. F2084L TaxID=2926419 RepID=UPI001FF1DD66|nr:sulfite exporter TauE/SafE family protein [Yoonia sp. F2084L]MCK0096544.1 sulfite exporter TauE/SafE family protein [Yoonia sp. F2084L]